MPSALVYAYSGDGRTRAYSAAWATIRAQANANDADNAVADDYACWAENTNPAIGRGHFAFDLSTANIPSNATVTALEFNPYVTGKASGGGGTTANNSVSVVSSTQASTTSLVVADYSRVGSTEWVSSRTAFSAFTTSAYNAMTLNSAAVAAAQAALGGAFKLALRSGYDLDNVAPTGNSYITVKYTEYAGTAQDPYLLVTYTLPQVTITADAVIKQTATKTATSDAVIISSVPKTATSDAIIKQTATKTVTADAIINPPSVQRTFTADAFIHGTSVKAARTRTAYAAPVTVFNPGSIGTHSAHYAFPCSVETEAGVIFAVCRKGTGHNILDGDIVAKTSADNGATWSSEVTIVDHTVTGYDERDPCIRKLSTGRLALVWSRAESHSPQNRFHAGLSFSDDNGNTWSTPVNMTTGHSVNDAVASDILDLPNGDLICCTHGRAVEGTGLYDVRVSKSTDNGATWADLALVASGSSEGTHAVEPQLVMMANGVLLCHYHIADGPPQTYKYKTSSDNGATWSAATTMTGGGTGVGQTDRNRAGVEVHPDGDIIFAYTNSNRADSYFRVSTDNAASWSTSTEAIEVTQSTNPPSLFGGVWASPCRLVNSHARDPDLGVIAGFENSSQDQAQVRWRAFNSAATYTTFNTAAVTADAIITTATTTTKTVASDAVIVAGSATQRTKTVTADAVIMARGATRTLTADAIIASGAAPPGALVRPFAAPLVVSSATAPLVVSSATAPLSMETT